MRYILALMPSKQHVLAYVQAAQNMFAPMTDGYLLNEENSLPHVTICAFSCEDKELDALWNDLHSADIGICPVRMLALQLKKGQVPQYHYSVGLTVARDPPLLQLHQHIVNVLRSRQIECLNPCMELYQPHLTLAGIAWMPDESVVLSPAIDDLISMSIPPFRLVLAKGDDIGQCLQILYELPEAAEEALLPTR